MCLVLDKQSADIKIPNKLRNNSISFWTKHVQNLNFRFQKKTNLVTQNTLLLINFGDVSLLLITFGGLKRTFFILINNQCSISLNNIHRSLIVIMTSEILFIPVHSLVTSLFNRDDESYSHCTSSLCAG